MQSSGIIAGWRHKSTRLYLINSRTEPSLISILVGHFARFRVFRKEAPLRISLSFTYSINQGCTQTFFYHYWTTATLPRKHHILLVTPEFYFYSSKTLMSSLILKMFIISGMSVFSSVYSFALLLRIVCPCFIEFLTS